VLLANLALGSKNSIRPCYSNTTDRLPLHKAAPLSSLHPAKLCCRKLDSIQTSPINPLKPNDAYMGRTAPLTSKRCILYIYSTNIGTEYFKHGIYSRFFPLQNAVCFISLIYLVPVLFIFCIQGVLKFKK